jgi:hypothetical protein
MAIGAERCRPGPQSSNERSITYLPDTYVRNGCEPVFVSKTRFTDEDRAFFAGFVAGDGSFLIRSNNAGSSWCCLLDVRLRADNTPLLRQFQQWTGLGRLVPVAARGNSAPQTSWRVERQLECLELAAILTQWPPLGKAGRQFEIWRRAVEISVARGGACDALPALAAELRRLHGSIAPVACPVDITEPALAAFLAGFASAEAHFGVTDHGSSFFTINLRADDRPLLTLSHETFGVGRLKDVSPYRSSKAAVSWRVGRRAELRQLVRWFDRYPPRGRAGHVYSAWRELVMLETRSSQDKRALATEIRRRRSFQPGLDRVDRTRPLTRRRERARNALLRWAETSDYPGSATDYERWRRSVDRSAPGRNTVAASYGSWLGALEAAGLDTTHAHPPERVDAIRRGNARGHARRQARHRLVIVAAVRQCIAEIGHRPSATEFLRWRARSETGCPSAMTIYRVFPGGFAEVLAAATASELDELAA